MQSTVEELRIRLKNAADFLFQKSLVRGVEGNISARVPELDAMLIKPTGLPMNKIPPEDYVLIGLDGRVLEGSRPPSKETPMHLEIYRRRPEVNAVVHTHSKMATVFAITGKPVRAVWMKAAVYGLYEVPVLPFLRSGSVEMGVEVAKALEGRRAVLLQNHGSVSVGRSIEEACSVALALEETAEMQFLASILGSPRFISLEEMEIIKKTGE